MVTDSLFQRIKIKSLRYQLLKEMRNRDTGPNPITNKSIMLQVVRIDEEDSFITLFPQWKTLFETTKSEYYQFCDFVQKLYDSQLYNENKKEASKVFKKYKFSDGIFDMKFANENADKPLTASEFFSTYGINPLRKFINSFMELNK